ESDTEYDDPFDSKGEKIKESKLLIDELDLRRSSDSIPSPEYDSFLFEDFSKVDTLPSTNNEDKGHKAFKVIKILESPIKIFPCSHGEDIRILDVPCLHFYPP
nr:hypothetical protein [Tanacetum cinerariifolium]